MSPPVSDLKGAPRRYAMPSGHPLTSDTAEQAGGYQVDGSPLAKPTRAPGPLDGVTIRTGLTLRATPPQSRTCLRNEKSWVRIP
jgi:hypothetical protein